MDSNISGMSVEDAARQAGICRTLIFRAIKDGQLKAKRFGGRTIILSNDLNEFLLNLSPKEMA
jgi:excisionase family DNA binding protein